MGYASKEFREAAVAAVKERRGTKSAIARIFGITRKTLRTWLAVDEAGGEQVPKAERGHPPCILKEEDYAQIYRKLKENPFITCDEMIEMIGVNCKNETMRKAYHKLGFTHKRRTRFASQKLKEENVAKRDNFLEIRENLDPEKLVFIDESSIKTNHSSLYGWSASGERSIGYAPCSWKSMTMIGALRLKEKFSPTVTFCEENVTRNVYREFMEDVLLPELKRGDIVIMDNASIHKNSFKKEKFTRRGIKILYLPPYCPELNPIEHMWSKMKAVLRKIGARTKEALWDAINQALWQITPDDRSGWFKGCGYVQ